MLENIDAKEEQFDVLGVSNDDIDKLSESPLKELD
jgi:hypothetical protein